MEWSPLVWASGSGRRVCEHKLTRKPEMQRETERREPH